MRADLHPALLRAARERAIDRMEQAAYATWWATGMVGLLSASLGWDAGRVLGLDPSVGSLLATALLGWGVFRRRQWPAAILTISFAAMVIQRWLTTGPSPALAGAAIIGTLIVRGTLASFDYAELTTR